MLIFLLCLIAFLIALILWAISPGRHKDTKRFKETLYAHRGLFDNDGDCPENSLAAFRRAKERGYGVELDVRLTADHQVVVFHDDDLARMCSDPRRVDECTYEELQQLHLLNTDEKIPLLEDVLAELESTTVLCEFKPMRNYADATLCRLALPILESHKGDFFIESFNPLMLRWFKKQAPHVVRGILSKKFEPDEVEESLRFPLSAMLTNFLCRPHFISYQHSDKDYFFFKLCRMLRPVTIAWTIRNVEETKQIIPTFDSYIFEGFEPENHAEKTF